MRPDAVIVDQVARAAILSDVARVFPSCPDRVMPSASRLLLEAGSKICKLREEVGALPTVFREFLAP